MSKFLDPLENGKTIGFLYYIIGALNLLGGISNPFALIFGFIQLVIGYGLRQTRLWVLYLLGGMVVLRIVIALIGAADGVEFTFGSALSIVFDMVIFAWLFSARSRMKK